VDNISVYQLETDSKAKLSMNRKKKKSRKKKEKSDKKESKQKKNKAFNLKA